MLVLKRLADARRDGDEIIAVIAGSAVNHDGRSNGLLAPNPDAQDEVLRKAYKNAGINPRDVDYVEAHGTGTILGDPIEADALGRVIGRGRAADKPALLGAVKSNVGHLESAAGAASLAKMALALQNDKIPPSINYAGPNPYIDFERSTSRSPTPSPTGPATAGTRSPACPASASAAPTRTWCCARCCRPISSSPNRKRTCRRGQAGDRRRRRGLRRRCADGRVRRVHRRR